MKALLFLLGALSITPNFYSQVGIGITTPSPASMLEVSSTSDEGDTYAGFMPPRVPDILARDAILASTTDVGLLVYVENLGCLQLWNGSGWESVHCINTVGFANLYQNFDLNTTWGYSSDVPFFDNGTRSFFGITDNSRGGFSHITTLTNNFLGINDLNDPEHGNGTAQFATITFTTIDLSLAPNGATISFDYEFYRFDGGDKAYYTIILDGIAQPEVTLIEGSGNLSLSGSVLEIIPPGTISASLRIRIKQDGADDYAGFDNFAIVAN
ncbi:hypothetical protein EI546_02460 [Aequorivita sp. H23M31]|uniref:Uncharacterized protein n=1 Tax=Aequorivita ciconiae TaxID=2494375 RepID=A0A410G056_9FLAO|nr:hypothetical protein [Aequorivita sp. H23M31]QAA80658.1 hypothetical protein EI546_02460 [Aequorivita sp. H23M31]